jgi:hypothetical protein
LRFWPAGAVSSYSATDLVAESRALTTSSLTSYCLVWPSSLVWFTVKEIFFRIAVVGTGSPSSPS